MRDGLWSPYCGVAPTPPELWARWNLDPVLIGALLVAAVLLAWRGVRTQQARPALAWLALVLLAVGFVSPLCAASSALFSARTVHHVLLVAMAAPLIAWSAQPLPMRGLTASLACHAGAFWAWHAPAMYEAALAHDAVYWAMQASLLGSAIWFWSAVRNAPTLAALGALLAATIQMGLLGALLTFAPAALYAPHALTTAAWGLAPLEDQQIAGLIMWAPASALYLAAALTLLGRQLTGRRLLAAT